MLIQQVGAVVVSTNPQLTVDDVRRDLRGRIAGYKLPRVLKLYPEIPRNVSN
jgi:acyl-CoA synthetase (AMP-forming)/AMP-acid ligase II